jgi:hypothetical protein
MAFLVPAFAAIGSSLSGVLGTTAAAGAASSVGTTLAVGSSILGAAGTLAQANAQKQAANYNAQVQDQQARLALNTGGAQATEIAQRAKQRMAATRATFLQNGMSLGGSASDVLDAVNKQGTLDELTALYDAQTKSRGYAANASVDRATASYATSAGWLGAGTSLLTGTAKLYY